MKNITRKSILILAGASLGSNIQVHIPVAHKKPSPEVICSYLKAKWYNPQKSHKDWERSEARKQQLLSDIRKIRTQIREVAQMKGDIQAKLIREDNLQGKLIQTCVANLENASRCREYRLKMEAARELKVGYNSICYKELLPKKAIVQIDMSNLVPVKA